MYKVKYQDDLYDQRAFWFFFIDRSYIINLRAKIYCVIAKNVQFSSQYKVLDLGVTDKDDNYFHKLYPFKKNITTAGLAPKNEYIKRDYPEVKYVQIKPKCPYPFKDKAFDFVHSSAVIEHVGSRQKQQEFLKEVNRIGKSGVITTPNRWFPLEFHTFLPFIHWLPTNSYRKFFKLLGFKFYAEEKNLNLLGLDDLDALAKNTGFKKYKIISYKSLGLVSNYLLFWFS
jgi:hypothetical protein